MIQFTPISAVTIAANRQRTFFDAQAHEELKNSIRTAGLLHAPVMRDEGGTLVLVAGECRMKAMIDLHELGIPFKFNNTDVPEGFMPYVTLGQLSELEAEEAELEENVKRKDLTPVEKAMAIKRVHDLRTKQAEARGEVHTVADTAKELTGRSDGGYQGKIRDALAVANNQHLPGVQKAKTMQDAVKIVKAEDARQRNIALATSVGATFSAKDHVVVQEDSEVWIKRQPDGVYDVILTDPPYGMGADRFGDGGGKLSTADHLYEDSYEYWQKFMDWFCPEIFRVAKAEAHAYIFCDFDNFHELKERMQKAGWYVFRTPIMDYKLEGGRVPLPEHGPRRAWEICLYAIKGKKKVLRIAPDVIPCSADENMGFGAQKPVSLFTNLLQRSCQPGDKVLDVCAGTGTILPAAHALKCQATAIERSANQYGICLRRLKDLQAIEQGVMGDA